MFDDEYLWPEPGQGFFKFERSRPDAYTWMHRSFHEYAYMYWRSAEALMQLASDAPGLLNRHAIPAVFLFRHYVELSLKSMLVDAGRLNDRTEAHEGHRLVALWEKLRALIASADLDESEADRESLDVAGEMIRELDGADPDSMAFRYPINRAKSGSGPLLSDDYEYFDMRTFHEQATRLAHFIDGCSSQLDAFVDIKREMDEYYAWE
jgi:hypothetical protein